MKFQNLKFKKSSFSPKGGDWCVGIAREEDKIIITNTKSKNLFISYTKEEWEAFIMGVKNNEFDFELLVSS